jgi:hypothetical protein
VHSAARYRVIGSREYREHRPGDLFEAKLDRRAEARAIGRGDIEVVERITFSVKPGSYRLPDRRSPSDE